jgi:hypothetical protein
MRSALLFGLVLVPFLLRQAVSQELPRPPMAGATGHPPIRQMVSSPPMVPAHLNGRPIAFGSYGRSAAASRPQEAGSPIDPKTTAENLPQDGPAVRRPAFLQTNHYFDRQPTTAGREPGEASVRVERRPSFFWRLFH